MNGTRISRSGIGLRTLTLDSGADPLIAAFAGSSARISGGDPAPYAERMISLWTGAGVEASPNDPALSAQQADMRDKIAKAFGLEGLVNRMGLILLGIVVVGFGLYLVAKD